MLRRAFTTGIISALAAPAVVKAENLMKLYVPVSKLYVDVFDPVLISLIRRTYPSILAQEIISVQPMMNGWLYLFQNVTGCDVKLDLKELANANL